VEKESQPDILIEDEMQAYIALAIKKYPDDVSLINNIVESGLYKKSDGVKASAEIAYILEHGELPEWATVIENAIPLGDGNYRFHWYDPLTRH